MNKIFPTKFRIVLFGFVMLFGSIAMNAQDENFSETQLTAEGQKAFQILLTASAFEDVSVGEGGSLSEYVGNYRVLLEEKERVEAFRLLLEKAATAGKLYALCGLFDVNHKYFLTVIEKFKSSEEMVEVQSGCVLWKERVKDVVFTDNPKIVRLKNPSQTIEDWQKSVGRNKYEDYSIDIHGGGFSLKFRRQIRHK